MQEREPITELQPQFSSAGAKQTPWSEARDQLEKADVYWISTVRPNGRPHVTPFFAVWLEGALYFCTGPGERKAKNLVLNPYCVITTGCNEIEGLDVVVEGEAVNVTDPVKLQRVADLFDSKYGMRYTVHDGAFYGDGGIALVYKLAPVKAFGFGKGENFSQTRWRFQNERVRRKNYS